MLKFLPRQLIIPHAKFWVHNSSVKVLAEATYITQMYSTQVKNVKECLWYRSQTADYCMQRSISHLKKKKKKFYPKLFSQQKHSLNLAVKRLSQYQLQHCLNTISSWFESIFAPQGNLHKQSSFAILRVVRLEYIYWERERERAKRNGDSGHWRGHKYSE